MQFTTTVEVAGMKMFNDTVEGKAYNNTKLFLKTDLDASNGTALGFATQEYAFGDSSEFQKLKHLPFPFMAEVYSGPQ